MIRVTSAVSPKELDVGGTVSILHTTEMFVKGHMLRLFNLIGSQVKIEYVLEGLCITKKDTRADAMFETAGTMSTSRKGRDFTSKGTEVLKVRGRASTEFEARESAVAMRDNVVEAQVVMKRVGPEFEGKTSTIEDGTQRILDGAMRAFTRAILMGRVGSSGFNGIPSLLEQGADISGFAQVTTKIHANILMLDIFSTSMFG